MKKIFFAIITGWFICQVHISTAQKTKTPSLDDAVEKVFQNLDLSILKTKYLIDRSQFIIDPGKFTGVKKADEIADVKKVQACYNALRFSCQECTYQLPDDLMNTVKKDLKKNVIPVGIFHMNYDKIKTKAFTENLLKVTDNQLFDVAGRPQSPYEVKRLFIASPLATKTIGSIVDFKVDKSYYFDNTEESVEQIQIDFGDGRGYQQVTLGNVYNIHYSAVGDKTIQVKLTTSGNVYESVSTFKVEGPIFNSRSIRNLTPDAQINVENINSRVGLPHMVGGTGEVFLGCDGVLDRPVILVEGFDGENTIGWRQVVWGFRFSRFLNQLQNSGYDVIVLDFDDGTDFIQNNAAVLRDLLRQVNQMKVGSHENIVIGASMGGLVGRYELSRMETEQVPHEVGLFVAYDSPHQGANIPVGLQQLTAFFATLTSVVSFIPAIQDIQVQNAALASPASRQMIRQFQSPLPDPLYVAFRAELAGFGNQGYPQLCRNVAMFDGSNNATGIDGYTQNYQRILEVREYRIWLALEIDVWSNSTPVALPSNRVRIDVGLVFFGIPIIPLVSIHHGNLSLSPEPLDRAPGGTLNTQEQVANGLGGFANTTTLGRPTHCFIPTVSALDINANPDLFYNVTNENPVINGRTPFDAIYGMADNTRHVTLDHQDGVVNGNTGTINFIQYVIEQELQPENLYLQNRAINVRRNFEARRNIVIGNGVFPANFSNNAITRPNGDVVISSNTTNIRAGQEIRFLPGFSVGPDANMTAYLDAQLITRNCNQGIVDGARTTQTQVVTKSAQTKTTTPVSFENVRLKVYPNPTVGKLNIDYNIQEDGDYVTVNLHNAFGQTVAWIIKKRNHIKGQFKVTYDASHLKKGIYYCTLRTSKIRKTFKVIVQ